MAGQVKPISIVVTQDIAGCVEVWRELVEFLGEEGRDQQVAEAQKKAIWVTSGVPVSGRKARVEAAYSPREMIRTRRRSAGRTTLLY
jgi:type III restriction enzyme